MDINKNEVIRYLGYKGEKPDEKIDALIEDCMRDIMKEANPKNVQSVQRIKRTADGTLIIGNMNIKSDRLFKNLLGCDSVIIFAATLGVAVDNLLRRLSLIDMASAVTMQAVAAAAIEGYCNEICIDAAKRLEAASLYLRPRFSPGYGDFSMRHQRQILDILESQKRIGLMITSSSMLVPSKSVTALMGISEHDNKCIISGCEECDNYDCDFRRS